MRGSRQRSLPSRRSRIYFSTDRRKSDSRVRSELTVAVLTALREREPSPESILCLGIGKLQSAPAQYQLAMLLALRRGFEACLSLMQRHPPERCSVTVYDPLFDDEDVALVRRLGMELPADNKVRAPLISAENIPSSDLRSPTCPSALASCTKRCCGRTGTRLVSGSWFYAATTWRRMCRKTPVLRWRASVRFYAHAARHLFRYAMPVSDEAPPGALEAVLHTFFSALNLASELDVDQGWTYRAAPRGRPRRGKRAPPRAPPAIEDYWTLPPATCTSQEVLSTPIGGS